MSSITSQAKQLLWKWYGSEEHRAEWDGRVYGGGKISQRFWEYFAALELLDLKPGSIVLDIGGGSPSTGLSILPQILAKCGVKMVVLDSDFGEFFQTPIENTTAVVGRANKKRLVEVINEFAPTHVTSISVLEHASREEQRGIFEAIEEAFFGKNIVMTFEFHEHTVFVENMMTTETLSFAVSVLNRYYLDRIEKSPLHCVNAFKDDVRLWYPLALRFSRAE